MNSAEFGSEEYEKASREYELIINDLNEA